MNTSILYREVKCSRCGQTYDANRQRTSCPHGKPFPAASAALSALLLLSSLSLSAGALHVPTPPAKPTQSVPVVNINTADETQLEFLPGVGDATSAWVHDRIIERGPYTSVEQLLEVRGIGPVKLARMRPYVVLNGATTATHKIKTPKTNTKGAKP